MGASSLPEFLIITSVMLWLLAFGLPPAEAAPESHVAVRRIEPRPVANALRLRADRITAALRKDDSAPRGFRTLKTELAQLRFRRGFSPDRLPHEVEAQLRVLEEFQANHALEPVDELRALTAVGRLLQAIDEHLPGLIPDEQFDRQEVA